MRNVEASSGGSGRIAASIAVGVVAGVIFAYLYPFGFYSPLNRRAEPVELHRATSAPCEHPETTKTLKMELSSLSKERIYLKKQLAELILELQYAVRVTEQAEKQFLALGPQRNAGPIGAVEGLRTNPEVIPDESVNPRLADLLKKVAIRKELIVTLATSHVLGELKLWHSSINEVGIPNHLVVALDGSTERFCKSRGIPVYKKDIKELGFMKSMKFSTLREFLQLGYSVLFSGVDVVFLQNPFYHFYRDSDIEAMSDGHDNSTAYGAATVSDDPKLGWGRYSHKMKIWVFNSGFFYIRPTIPSIELLDRVAMRLNKNDKDHNRGRNIMNSEQAAMNEELFFPSSPRYDGLHASKRVMDISLFMNSKVLFEIVRKDADKMRRFLPVVVHLNYHHDKLPRMQAVVDYYVRRIRAALDRFP